MKALRPCFRCCVIGEQVVLIVVLHAECGPVFFVFSVIPFLRILFRAGSSATG